MTEELDIRVNGLTFTIPNTVETASDILEETGFNPNNSALYIDTGGETLSQEQQVYPNNSGSDADPVVVDDGDTFVVIPQSTTGG